MINKITVLFALLMLAAIGARAERHGDAEILSDSDPKSVSTQTDPHQERGDAEVISSIFRDRTFYDGAKAQSTRDAVAAGRSRMRVNALKPSSRNNERPGCERLRHEHAYLNDHFDDLGAAYEKAVKAKNEIDRQEKPRLYAGVAMMAGGFAGALIHPGLVVVSAVGVAVTWDALDRKTGAEKNVAAVTEERQRVFDRIAEIEEGASCRL